MSQMRLGSKSSDSFICILNDAYEVIKTDYTNIMKKIVISKKSKVMLGDSSVTEESTFEPGGVVSFYRETTLQNKRMVSARCYGNKQRRLSESFCKIQQTDWKISHFRSYVAAISCITVLQTRIPGGRMSERAI